MCASTTTAPTRRNTRRRTPLEKTVSTSTTSDFIRAGLQHNQFARYDDGLNADLYPETTDFFWEWDSEASRDRYKKLLNSSQSAERQSLLFSGLVVVNHLVSAIHAARFAGSIRTLRRAWSGCAGCCPTRPIRRSTDQTLPMNIACRGAALLVLGFTLSPEVAARERICGAEYLRLHADEFRLPSFKIHHSEQPEDVIKVGSQREFHVRGRFALLPATCRFVGADSYVFVEDAQWDDNGGPVLQLDVDFLGDLFEVASPADPTRGLFELETAAFGIPPDVDEDPRIFILGSPAGARPSGVLRSRHRHRSRPGASARYDLHELSRPPGKSVRRWGNVGARVSASHSLGSRWRRRDLAQRRSFRLRRAASRAIQKSIQRMCQTSCADKASVLPGGKTGPTTTDPPTSTLRSLPNASASV